MMNPAILQLTDEVLLALFRFRTRRFMQMEDAPEAPPPAPKTGEGCLYLHIPFCPALCPFCSFHRVPHRADLARRYFHYLREELRRYHEAGFRFGGAYFGGGTPTTEPGELVETIGLVRHLFGVREISVETNPKDLRPEILEPLRDAGVTRLSVGIQSFDDHLLKDMGRFDPYGSGGEALYHLRSAAGMFPTLNVDLIFNQPRQGFESFRRDLRILRSTPANQVSFYPLMASRSVAQRMRAANGLPDYHRARRFYEIILDDLMPEFRPSSAWCFSRETPNSNFKAPAELDIAPSDDVRAPQLNDEYLTHTDYYIGVGSGAFSYVDGALYVTTFSLQNYTNRIAEGLTGITARSRFSAADQMRYDLLVKMFGLRLDTEWAARRYGPRFFDQLWGELRTLECLGAAVRDERGWRLTRHGMFWLVLMMSAFFESVNDYRDAMRARVQEEIDHTRNGSAAFTPLHDAKSLGREKE